MGDSFDVFLSKSNLTIQYNCLWESNGFCLKKQAKRVAETWAISGIFVSIAYDFLSRCNTTKLINVESFSFVFSSLPYCLEVDFGRGIRSKLIMHTLFCLLDIVIFCNHIQISLRLARSLWFKSQIASSFHSFGPWLEHLSTLFCNRYNSIAIFFSWVWVLVEILNSIKCSYTYE